jgi:hypothetical protein
MAAQRKLAGIVDLGAGIFVDPVTVAVHPLDGKAVADAIGQRAADRGIRLQQQGIAADRLADIAGKLVGRLGGDQVDRTAGGIAAVKRALRPAQHFDPFEIEHRAELGLGQADHRAIDVERNRWVNAGQRARQADTANEQLGEVEIVAEADAGHQVLQPFDPDRVAFGQLLFADGRHRQRNIGKRLFALLRGDDDLIGVRGRVGSTILGHGRRCAKRQHYCHCAKRECAIQNGLHLEFLHPVGLRHLRSNAQKGCWRRSPASVVDLRRQYQAGLINPPRRR